MLGSKVHLNGMVSKVGVDKALLAFADRLVLAIEVRNFDDPGWFERKSTEDQPASHDSISNLFAKAVDHQVGIGL